MIKKIFLSVKLRNQMLAVAISTIMVFYNSIPMATFAQEESQSTPVETSQPSENPSPTSAPSTDVTNNADVTNDVNSQSESGDNTITTDPTPTPTEGAEEIISPIPDESPTPTPTPCEDTEQPPNGELGTPESTPSADIETGTSVSIVEDENVVNSTVINSGMDTTTVNQVGNQTGDINVSGVSQPSTGQGQTEGSGSSTNVDQSATVANLVESYANSGNNDVESASSAAITTGDAISVVSEGNVVNTTLIDSILQIFFINIFGTVNGNIILPEYGDVTLNNCTGPCDSLAVQSSSDATVTNTVNSLATSGGNSIVSSGSGQITTGDAISSVNLLNIINTYLQNVNFRSLTITNYGTWNGIFRGWDGMEGDPNAQSYTVSNVTELTQCSPDVPYCISRADIVQSAHVTNTISSTAQTGNNSLVGSSGSIHTGDAFSGVSLYNIVNSTLVNSIGIFGFINIFGELNGDIGGASEFEPTPTVTPPSESQVTTSSTTESQPEVRQTGGMLSVSQTNNVGEYVFPGDTVTFFITINNPGNGKVYDTVLGLELYSNGQYMGGQPYKIGNIKAGGKVNVTTGLVLSKDAQPGLYQARAIVVGHVGPENSEVTGEAYSQFTIYGASLPIVQTENAPPPGEPVAEVLSSESEIRPLSIEERLKNILAICSSIFLSITAVKRRKDLLLMASQVRILL